MLFLFGWLPCQRSDMTLVEVSRHAYDYLYIRTIVLFVFLRNSCKPDMVLVYILLNTLCLSLSQSLRKHHTYIQYYNCTYIHIYAQKDIHTYMYKSLFDRHLTSLLMHTHCKSDLYLIPSYTILYAIKMSNIVVVGCI